jgi:hypothetical protein
MTELLAKLAATLIEETAPGVPHQLTPTASPCASQAALLATIDLLRSNGGKIHLFASELPNEGIHRLTARWRGHRGARSDSAAALDAEVSMKQEILTAPDKRWTAAAVEACELAICVDIILMTQVCCAAATFHAFPVFVAMCAKGVTHANARGYYTPPIRTQ